MSEYHIRIVTPVEVSFDGMVNSIVVPGTQGYFGVLANHVPFLSSVKEGRLKVRKDERLVEFQIGDGFFEVKHNEALLMVRYATQMR